VPPSASASSSAEQPSSRPVLPDKSSPTPLRFPMTAPVARDIKVSVLSTHLLFHSLHQSKLASPVAVRQAISGDIPVAAGVGIRTR